VYYGTVTTEVQITTDICDTATDNSSQPPTPTPAKITQCPWGEGGGLDDNDLESGPIGGPSITCSGPGESSRRSPGSGASSHRHQPSDYRAATTITSTSTTRQNNKAAREAGGSTDRNNIFRRAWARFTAKLKHMDPVKLAYLRTSFVFAVSVLVTWTPSSINRLYSVVHPRDVSYGLNIASAAVLPLQGVWNAVIYFTTSWTTVREELAALRYRSAWLRRLGLGAAPTPPSGGGAGGGHGRRLTGPGAPAGSGAKRDRLGRVDHFDGRRWDRPDHLELSPRYGRTNTIRVQRGGQFDI